MSEQPEEPGKIGKTSTKWISVAVALIPLALIAVFLLYFYR